MKFIVSAAIVAYGLGYCGRLIYASRAQGGEIICTDHGMAIDIGKIEGLDPNAVRQGLFYLCDPETIGFGYANPRWVWI